MVKPRKKEITITGKRIRRPVEDEALSRVMRWEKRVKKGEFDVAYFRTFGKYPVFAEEQTGGNVIALQDN